MELEAVLSWRKTKKGQRNKGSNHFNQWDAAVFDLFMCMRFASSG